MDGKYDGGAAFPDGVSQLNRVMTLRDWFAGQALAGLLAHQAPGDQNNSVQDAAEVAYIAADFMLAEREIV